MPLNRIPEFPFLLAEMLNQIPRQQRLTPIYLGGTSGSSGGQGQPPGGFVGKLPQSYVAYDTDEFALTSGSGSLVDNLNHIRYWQKSQRWFEAHQGTPVQNRVYVEPGIWTHTAGSQPLIFSGSYSPSFTSGSVPHVDVLYLTTSGSLAWSTSANTTPVYPGGTTMPIWEVYIRSSGSTYNTDQGTNNYLFRDVRPFLNLGSGGSASVSGTPTRIPYFNTTTSLSDNKDFLLTFDTTGSPILVLGSHNNLSVAYSIQARIQVISDNQVAGLAAFSFSDTASAGGFHTLGHSGGTRAAPTSTLSGFALGRTNYLGTITSGSTGIGTTSARIEAIAYENFTTGSQGTYLSFSTTRANTNALVQSVRMDHNRLVLGVSGVYPDAGIPLVDKPGIYSVSDSTRATIVALAYGTTFTPVFQGYRARGTSGSPTAVQSGDILFEFDGNGHDGVAWSGIQALAQATASENWTASAHGTNWKWYATPNGSTALTGPVMQIDTNGLSVSGGFNLGSATNAPTGQLRQSSGSQIWNGAILSAVTGGPVVVGSGVAQRVALWNGTNDISSDADFTFNGTQLALATSGSTGGIIIGGDVVLFRRSAERLEVRNTLRAQAIGANLDVSGVGEIRSASYMWSLNDGSAGGFLSGSLGDVQFYRNSSDVWRTPDSLIIDGSLTVSTSGSASGNITSGTYTPVLTNGANVATSTPFQGQWIRVGNVVQVGVRIEVDPTTAATQTIVSGTLPIPSNFGNVINCTGTGGSSTAGSGEVRADSTTDLWTYAYTCVGNALAAHYLTFTYLII